jgi:hypothetical protein
VCAEVSRYILPPPRRDTSSQPRVLTLLSSGYDCTTGLNSNGVKVVSGSTTSAPLIQIRWASSDLSVLQTDPLTGGTLRDGGLTSTTSRRTTSTTRRTTSNTSLRSGGDDFSGSGSSGPSALSAGAIAGIIIGTAIVVCVLLGVACAFLCLRMRKNKMGPPTAPPPMQQPAGYHPHQSVYMAPSGYPPTHTTTPHDTTVAGSPPPQQAYTPSTVAAQPETHHNAAAVNATRDPVVENGAHKEVPEMADHLATSTTTGNVPVEMGHSAPANGHVAAAR